MSKKSLKSIKALKSEDLLDKEYESDSESSIEFSKNSKPTKPKKKLSEKQLEAMAKGREKALEVLKGKTKTKEKRIIIESKRKR